MLHNLKGAGNLVTEILMKLANGLFSYEMNLNIHRKYRQNKKNLIGTLEICAPSLRQVSN